MTARTIPRAALLLLLSLPFPTQAFSQEALEECTAGVASGLATTDGRPLLWKTRDASATDNEVIWNTSGQHHFVSVISAGHPESSWMGVNEKGFAIINTLSTDLPMERNGLQLHNGSFMVHALQQCATVEEFEELLRETNDTGRMTNTNYGVLDATGAAAFFETAGHEYWRYDADDREKGYVLRTNFAINGERQDGRTPYSMDRFLQTDELMREFYRTDKIDFEEIIKGQVRSFGDPEGNLVPLPFTESIEGHEPGYFPHSSSINRNSTVSFAVIQGVLPGEDPRLSTMWTILGQPSTGVTVPYWPVGDTPQEADGPETAPLNDAANRIRAELYDVDLTASEGGRRVRPLYINTQALQDADGEGIWSVLLPAEDAILAESQGALERWRASGVDADEMLETEARMARRALEAIRQAYEYLMGR